MEKRILTYPSSSRPSPTLEFLEFQESIGECYGEMHTVSASEASASGEGQSILSSNKR